MYMFTHRDTPCIYACMYCATQIQVAHMQPDIITLVGEGVFPRIGLNLPSQLTEPNCTEYNSLRQRARENLISTVGSERLAENPVSPF